MRPFFIPIGRQCSDNWTKILFCWFFGIVLACIYQCLDVFKAPCAAIAPAVERTLGKGEVACSNHASSTIFHLSFVYAIKLAAKFNVGQLRIVLKSKESAQKHIQLGYVHPRVFENSHNG